MVVLKPLIRSLRNGYGNKIRPIFDACCSVLDWQKYPEILRLDEEVLLEAVTPEGWDVWFLPFSSWREKDYPFSLKVLGDGKIQEVELNPCEELVPYARRRVTFLKRKGEYYFLGVYNLVSIDHMRLRKNVVDRKGYVVRLRGETVRVHTLLRVSDYYPYTPTEKEPLGWTDRNRIQAAVCKILRDANSLFEDKKGE